MIANIRIAIVLLTVLLFGLAGRADAAPIMFTFETTASGTIGGNAFTNENIILKLTGDTDNRTGSALSPNADITQLIVDTATIEITNQGTFQISTPISTFVNRDRMAVGAGNFLIPADFIGSLIDPAFATWDMLSSIGPITSSGTILASGTPANDPIGTSGGDLRFNNGSPSVTYTATVIPEPASLALLGLGSLALIRRRRRRRAR